MSEEMVRKLDALSVGTSLWLENARKKRNKMKIEIDITPEEIKDAVQRKVRVAIADINFGTQWEKKIKEVIAVQFDEAVGIVARDILSEQAKIKAAVTKQLAAKLKKKLEKLMEEE